MKSVAIQTKFDKLDPALQTLKDSDLDILILFTSRDNVETNKVHEKITATLPDVTLLGCSTSGEIGDSVEDNSISLLGLKFENTEFKSLSLPIKGTEESYAVGTKIAQELKQDNLAGIFILLPGLNVNGSQFTKGMKEALPDGISVSGGMAGDGLNFEKTYTVLNGEMSSENAVALALYGDHVTMSTGSRGGWRPFGPKRRVTKVENNVLYEIDNKPALELYKEYLGDKAADLPSSGLLYPFAIMDGIEDDEDTSKSLIRTILDINEEENSLVLAGDMEVGQIVCLMHATTDELTLGAEQAAEVANKNCNKHNDHAVICVSCVGRKILMGDDTEDELDAVRDVFDNHDIAGFYSYGEICPIELTGVPELHNQTMTITHISERAA